MPEAEAEQLIRDWIELTNKQDVSQLREVVSEAFVWKTPAAPTTVRGPDAAADVARGVMEAFPDFEAELVDMIVADDRGMAEVRFTGTHEGSEFNGIPPTGRRFELDAMSKWRVDGGKLQELRDYANMQEVLDQLGATE